MRSHLRGAGSVVSCLVLLVAACTSAPNAPAAPPAATAVPSGASGAAAPAPDAKLIADAKAEGSVVLYGSPRIEALQADAAEFEKRYGIKVMPTTMTGAVLTTRVDAEVGGGNVAVDVIFSPDEVALAKWIAAGELAKLPDHGLPKPSEYYAPIQVIGQGVVYNTNLVAAADVPKTWADVLAPRWKGQIILGSPRISTAYSQTYVALLRDAKYGTSFYEKLAAQEPRVLATVAPMVQSVASGEAALAFIGFPQDVANLKLTAPTAPVDFAYLDATTNALTHVAVMAKGKHPNAARLFAQWIMSAEGQAVHNGSGRASSALGQLGGTLPPPPAAAVRKITSSDAATETPNVIALFDRLYK